MAGIGEILLDQSVGIVDAAHRGDGVQTEMGTDQQRLRIGVTDTADAAAAVEVLKILLELGTEGRILNVVDLALEPVSSVINSDAATTGTQMSVIVYAEIQIQYAVSFRDSSEKAAHYAKNSSLSFMGSIYAPSL